MKRRTVLRTANRIRILCNYSLEHTIPENEFNPANGNTYEIICYASGVTGWFELRALSPLFEWLSEHGQGIDPLEVLESLHCAVGEYTEWVRENGYRDYSAGAWISVGNSPVSFQICNY